MNTSSCWGGRMSAAVLVGIAALAACNASVRVRAAQPDGAPAPTPNATPQAAERWWKGNTHTHTLWSDGDDFPEMVADWYKQHGYQFLALTDHNTLAADVQWWRVSPTPLGREALDKYRARFGSWVQERSQGESLFVRLRNPEEYRPKLNEDGKFLLVDGEEITQYLDRRGAHMTALNVSEVVPAQGGATLIDMFRGDLAVLQSQRAATGRTVVGVLNHPNFLWSQTAEDLLQLPGLRFFEVYNGHPLVNINGDSLHASNERIWDIVLTHRSARGEGLLYGVATDDSHDYHRFGQPQRNSGRGWVMVRAPQLEANALMSALERGNFYGSNGVVLDDVQFDGRRLSISIQASAGVTYTTQFIGTRRGYDSTTLAVKDTAGMALTRRYSTGVGAVLSQVTGSHATYTMRGDELYVRARVISSRAKSNPSFIGEVESAWIQPVRQVRP